MASTPQVKVILDASAVLAVLYGESGADFVTGMMRGALMSSVNYSEALAKAGSDTGSYEGLPKMIDRFDVTVVPFDRGLGDAAAKLESRTRKRNVSFADRACLAFGADMALPILTGDRKWPLLGLDLDIRLIR